MEIDIPDLDDVKFEEPENCPAATYYRSAHDYRCYNGTAYQLRPNGTVSSIKLGDCPICEGGRKKFFRTTPVGKRLIEFLNRAGCDVKDPNV
jgi:hypothetical protein